MSDLAELKLETAPVLSLEHIEAGYGKIKVLHKIDLVVCEREIVAIIGANGAGKTTTLMCTSGVHRIQRGQIMFFGQDISRLEPHTIVGMGLIQVPEGRKIFPRLSVTENLELGAYLRNDKRALIADYERIFALFPVLKERRFQAGGTLSGGEQQMLAIGRALMSRPRVLLLDEPSMGIAPILVDKIFETIVSLNKDGLTILLVEQDAHIALSVADRGYVMETGNITLHDTGANLLRNPKVRQAYLGE